MPQNPRELDWLNAPAPGPSRTSTSGPPVPPKAPSRTELDWLYAAPEAPTAAPAPQPAAPKAPPAAGVEPGVFDYLREFPAQVAQRTREYLGEAAGATKQFLRDPLGTTAQVFQTPTVSPETIQQALTEAESGFRLSQQQRTGLEPVRPPLTETYPGVTRGVSASRCRTV